MGQTHDHDHDHANVGVTTAVLVALAAFSGGLVLGQWEGQKTACADICPAGGSVEESVCRCFAAVPTGDGK